MEDLNKDKNITPESEALKQETEAVTEEIVKEETVIESENAVNQNVSQVTAEAADDGEKPLDKNVKLMSPTRMVLRRFFRSKLSLTGLIMLCALFVCSARWFTARGAK